uniref:Uncharacterized protein n=1 Tax=Arundo donax TaxID=35708 RepID=A0A0A9B3E0_ARUDO
MRPWRCARWRCAPAASTRRGRGAGSTWRRSRSTARWGTGRVSTRRRSPRRWRTCPSTPATVARRWWFPQGSGSRDPSTSPATSRSSSTKAPRSLRPRT